MAGYLSILFLTLMVGGYCGLVFPNNKTTPGINDIEESLVYCMYAGQNYQCGSKAPNGQYCNYLSCSNGCCSLQWCANYISCVCETYMSNEYQCKN